MSSLLAHVKVLEGQEKKFEKLQKELYNQSHKNEDCIIRYEHYRGRDKNSYYTLLVYPTYLDFLLKHQISKHHEETGAKFGGVIESLDLEWLDPIEDAAPVGITEMQKVPEDASDLAKEYGDSHAAEIQDWWLKLRKVY
jgi:quinol monooxygenase YgiN